MTDKTVVLVHGAWHGAWCWEKVTPLLDAAGIEHVEVDLPLTTFEDDVAAVRQAVARAKGPVVLCGHSYGGAVVTEAGNRDNVERLVYLAAFACDEGESPASTAPEAEAASTDLADAFVISEDDGTIALDDTQAARLFFHDCATADAEKAVQRFRPMQFECLATPVRAAAWHDKPSTYVVCSEDRAVHPELQRIMAKRCTESVEWPTAHSPFLNRPDLVAELLVDLAAS